MSIHSDRVIAYWLALLLFGSYLLVFNGRITSSDGLSMFAVTDSAVKRGDLATDQLWTFFGTKSAAAPDGEVYSKYGYGTSLFAAPFYALALFVPFTGLMQAALLSNAVVVAIAGALVYLAARRLRFSALAGTALALLFGLATPAWVYAKEFWSEPFALVALFAAFYFLLVYRESSRTRDAVIGGVLLGLAIAVRTTNVLLVPLYALYAFVEFKPFRLRGRDLVAFLVPVALLALSVLVYNAVRFQNPLTTGYRADEDFSNPILLGVYGLMFSPGKGLLVYAPFLAAVPYGVWRFWHTRRRELWLFLLLFGVNLLLFSAWYYWWGGTNWAARFLVPSLPFLTLLCAPLLELLLNPEPHPTARGRWAYLALCVVFGALVLVSVLNELAGVSVNSLTYRLRTLNLSPNPDWDAIFVPALSPLLGHWQALRPTTLDFAWMRATPNAFSVDWVALLLGLAFVGYAAWMLTLALRGQDIPRNVMRLSVVIVFAVVGISLARYAGDPRLRGSEGYVELVKRLEQSAAADDVLVLGDDAHARALLNTNRARLKWYGLSRDPARWDAPTQALVKRLADEYPRLWFAYDENVDAPNPMRDWFAQNLDAVQFYDLGDGVRLVLYHAR